MFCYLLFLAARGQQLMMALGLLVGFAPVNKWHGAQGPTKEVDWPEHKLAKPTSAPNVSISITVIGSEEGC